MIGYGISLEMLDAGNLSIKARLFLFRDFPGYILISQVCSIILLVWYAVLTKSRKLFLIVVLLAVIYLLFDLFLNSSSQSLNPV